MSNDENPRAMKTPTPLPGGSAPAAAEMETTTTTTPNLVTPPRTPRKQHHRRQSTATDLPPTAQLLAEYHYLVGDLARQNARAMALLRSQDEKQAQIAAAAVTTATTATTTTGVSGAEARRSRKAFGFAQSQLADAEQQERLVWARLGDLCAQMQARRRLALLASERLQGRLGLGAQEEGQMMYAPALPLLPPPLETAQVPARVMTSHPHPHVTFAEPSPIVDHGDDDDDDDAPRQAWSEHIPLTPFATSFPPPFSSPFAAGMPATSPVAPMPSPMSPMAPVFQPRTGFCADDAAGLMTTTTGQSGQDSLDSVLAAVAEATQETLPGGGGGCTSVDEGEAAVSGDDNGSGDYVVVSGASDSSSGPSPAMSSTMRRGSHSAAPRTQDRHKRMSLPVRLSWDEM